MAFLPNIVCRKYMLEQWVGDIADLPSLSILSDLLTIKYVTSWTALAWHQRAYGTFHSNTTSSGEAGR